MIQRLSAQNCKFFNMTLTGNFNKRLDVKKTKPDKDVRQKSLVPCQNSTNARHQGTRQLHEISY